MVILLGLAAALATYLGGIFALRFKDQLHMILGFSAGAVLGVAFFDLLPEALELTSGALDVALVTALVAIGFVIFMVLNNWALVHPHSDDDCESDHHKGSLAAGSLALHSMLDGMVIGLAFQVSSAMGAVVAAAVLAHGFSDGINTVSLILKNKGSRKEAVSWLIVDAAAPFIGVLLGSLLVVSDHVLGGLLAVFCGFFLFIGASDLLPESHHHHSKTPTVFMTILGMAVVYAVITLAHI